MEGGRGRAASPHNGHDKHVKRYKALIPLQHACKSLPSSSSSLFFFHLLNCRESTCHPKTLPADCVALRRHQCSPCNVLRWRCPAISRCSLSLLFSLLLFPTCTLWMKRRAVKTESLRSPSGLLPRLLQGHLHALFSHRLSSLSRDRDCRLLNQLDPLDLHRLSSSMVEESEWMEGEEGKVQTRLHGGSLRQLVSRHQSLLLRSPSLPSTRPSHRVHLASLGSRHP